MENIKSENPLLRRDIELLPLQGEDGKMMIVARDPLELFANGPVALSSGALPLLAMLDGSKSAEDIRLSLVERTARAGQLTSIPLEVVESFISQLDEAYLLDNERSLEARTKLVTDFAALSERPAILAGKSYPEGKNELEELLDSLLLDADSSDGPGGELEEKTLLALVAPHIELRTGARVYSAAYGALKGRSYDRVVILGVGHSLEGGLFSITGKDFRTPLGVAPTDRQATEQLRKAAGKLAAPDDFAHRGEHSVEFQVIFLQRVLEGSFSVVPVLCGSLLRPLILERKKRPRQIDELTPALDCLAELLKDPSCKTLLLAGVDFSHVGPKFGDKVPAIKITADSSRHDKSLLAALVACDVESFCAESARVGDRYHVCGLSALSMLLEVLPPGTKGVELGHKVWHETRTQSAVSFAAAAFYEG